MTKQLFCIEATDCHAVIGCLDYCYACTDHVTQAVADRFDGTQHLDVTEGHHTGCQYCADAAWLVKRANTTTYKLNAHSGYLPYVVELCEACYLSERRVSELTRAAFQDDKTGTCEYCRRH